MIFTETTRKCAQYFTPAGLGVYIGYERVSKLAILDIRFMTPTRQIYSKFCFLAQILDFTNGSIVSRLFSTFRQKWSSKTFCIFAELLKRRKWKFQFPRQNWAMGGPMNVNGSHGSQAEISDPLAPFGHFLTNQDKVVFMLYDIILKFSKNKNFRL